MFAGTTCTWVIKPANAEFVTVVFGKMDMEYGYGMVWLRALWWKHPVFPLNQPCVASSVDLSSYVFRLR